MKRKGFTLAEVLITLTIIGVIAAITIPTLLQKYRYHQYVTGLKKAYSTLQNASKMIPLTENCPSGDYECAGMFIYTGQNMTVSGKEYAELDYKKILELLSKNMKTKEICLNNTDNCYSKYNKNFINMGIKAAATLEDGTVIALEDRRSASNPNPTISVDVNGFQGPGIYGRDMFQFDIAPVTQNGISAGTIIPHGSYLSKKYSNNVNRYWRQNNPCVTANIRLNDHDFGHMCTGRVLEENAMNY